MSEDNRILVHTCCAPCLCYPYKSLSEEGFDVWAFWYNPNIHPYQEYERRKKAFIKFTDEKSIRVLWRDEYNLEKFLNNAAYRQDVRCRYCYAERIKATVEFAKHGDFSYFTTTLLYSKFQQHQLIKDIARNYAQEYGVEFYYEDFREGWQEGIDISKELDLYRQQYCGCIYSERDRYSSEEDRKSN